MVHSFRALGWARLGWRAGWLGLVSGLFFFERARGLAAGLVWLFLGHLDANRPPTD